MISTRWAVSIAIAIGVCLAQKQPISSPKYVLAPKDHILIRASQSDKLNGRIFEVERTGFITLPGVGRLRAGGRTVESLEQQLAARLKPDSTGARVVLISVVKCGPSRPNCLGAINRN
jgi:protein involved in polysaccharide export with SLBB domain